MNSDQLNCLLNFTHVLINLEYLEFVYYAICKNNHNAATRLSKHAIKMHTLKCNGKRATADCSTK